MEPKRICPFYQKSCEEARQELNLRNEECEFASQLNVVKPPVLVGGPPRHEMVGMCLFKTYQQALNGLGQGLGMVNGKLEELRQVHKPAPQAFVVPN